MVFLRIKSGKLVDNSLQNEELGCNSKKTAYVALFTLSSKDGVNAFEHALPHGRGTP
jgi:hypothetical protein